MKISIFNYKNSLLLYVESPDDISDKLMDLLKLHSEVKEVEVKQLNVVSFQIVVDDKEEEKQVKLRIVNSVRIYVDLQERLEKINDDSKPNEGREEVNCGEEFQQPQLQPIPDNVVLVDKEQFILASSELTDLRTNAAVLESQVKMLTQNTKVLVRNAHIALGLSFLFGICCLLLLF